MKISTKGRYALRMLVDVAQHQSSGTVTLKEIAGRQGISKKYLEQIALVLSQAGILRGARGHQDALRPRGERSGGDACRRRDRLRRAGRRVARAAFEG